MTFSRIFSVVIKLLILALVFNFSRAASVLMGMTVSMAMIGVLKRRDRISVVDLLAVGIVTLAAALVTNNSAMGSMLIGIVSGGIVSSYVLAPGSSDLKRPIGRTLGILIGVLGSYFVSYNWAELVLGLIVGVLSSGLSAIPQQPPATAKVEAR